ncbi:MAG: hypothetical protein ACSW8K_01660 [bacterium]
MDLVRDSSFADLLEQLDVKRKEAAYLAHYYQAKALKLKNFQSVLGNAPELVGKYYIMNRPENYSLFTRSHSGKSLKMTNARDTEGGFEEITRNYPFVEHIYRLKKGELMLPEDLEEAEWGLTVKKYWADRLGIQLLPRMEHIRPVTALFTVITLDEQEYFTRSAAENALQYMEDHHYTLCGDILGVYIATDREGGRNVRYMELWMPIRGTDIPIDFSEDQQRRGLKKIFG